MTQTRDKRALTRAGLWRWRRNPLRRGSDLVEAWVLLVAWVLAVVGGALVGTTAAESADHTFEGQRAERHAVAATVVENARSAVDTKGAASRRVADDDLAWVTVRWRATGGVEHTGRTQVAPDTRTGTRVTVWTDQHGVLTARPLDPGEARVEAALLGTMAAAFSGGAVWACAYGVRERLEQRRMAQWDEEWRRMDTRWGRRTG
ncbi:Rv1733c family protein [Streptomyces bluensis]|uniref:Rv1733c family protein n=1 Tax=Streptomyces bluensis TaxID=33897 RepID=UPI00331B13B4